MHVREHELRSIYFLLERLLYSPFCYLAYLCFYSTKPSLRPVTNGVEIRDRDWVTKLLVNFVSKTNINHFEHFITFSRGGVIYFVFARFFSISKRLKFQTVILMHQNQPSRVREINEIYIQLLASHDKYKCLLLLFVVFGPYR